MSIFMHYRHTFKTYLLKKLHTPRYIAMYKTKEGWTNRLFLRVLTNNAMYRTWKLDHNSKRWINKLAWDIKSVQHFLIINAFRIFRVILVRSKLFLSTFYQLTDSTPKKNRPIRDAFYADVLVQSKKYLVNIKRTLN